jgi:hypothetical protein
MGGALLRRGGLGPYPSSVVTCMMGMAQGHPVAKTAPPILRTGENLSNSNIGGVFGAKMLETAMLAGCLLFL